ncbi:unnamed protein product [Plutella xylostella]|uniref:(diamondback moth) hypothetical protein n=1 Tax=Plutella xylostella TaxID=51655 RepID=A0A8S4E9S5_PLUXY|nr:unnamed protein product [Plutella xylostella]
MTAYNKVIEAERLGSCQVLQLAEGSTNKHLCTDKGWAGGDGAPRARAAPPPALPSRVTLPVFVVISPLKLLQRTSDYCTSINMTSPAITKSPDNQKGEKKSPSHSAGAPAEAAATEPAAASAPAPPAETFSWLRIFKLADLMMKQGC